ncbi:MAG: WD40 repeat domain-containing protein, partial [Candidatus Brocadiae bacterium]|nr:WD40 repeat domain-containing protein [Candidatus Brocadiia bacterium]
MGRILGTALWACLAVSAACAADAEWREVFAAEPFTGAPLRAGFAGRHGFAWGDGRAVRTFDLESGKDRGAFLEHAAEVGAAAASPDGSRIASGDGAGTIRIWDASTRREVLKIEGPPGAVVEIRWTPTGGHLGWVTEDGWLTIARAENGRTVADYDIEPGAEGEFVVSADGKWARVLFVSSAWDGRENLATLRTVQWNLLDGGAPRKRTWERRDPDPGARPYTGARIDPRDGRVAFADGDDLVVWSMDDDREAFRLEGGAGPVAFPAEGDLLVGAPA